MKKRIYLTFVSVLALGSLQAQDFTQVDQMVAAYPDYFATPEKLADRIKADFATDADKTRAMFTWIATHLSYDLNQAKEIRSGGGKVAFSYKNEADKVAKQNAFRYDIASKALRSKRGVCEHYTALFQLLCDFSGIPCLSIPGTSKTVPAHIGKLPQYDDHIWNAVKIAGQWKLLDVTWAAGAVSGNTGKFAASFNDGYFFTDPAYFALSHFPKDRKQALTEVSPESFAALPLFYGAYIKGKYELLSPYEGILKISKPVLVPIQIKGLPENAAIGYGFSSDRKLIRPEVKRVGDTISFDVPVENRSKGYLTLFLDGKSLVTFKLG